MKVDVFDIKGTKTETIDIPDKIFEKPNKDILWYYTKWYLASRRSGTHNTKTRSTVRGGGRKPWVQKHTGRARQGSIRAPHWRGGAVAHGPHPRDYSFKLNSKEKKEALRGAIAIKFNSGKMKIISEDNIRPKTKYAVQVINDIGAYPPSIFVTLNKEFSLALRNIPLVEVISPNELNAYTILKYDNLIIERNCFLNIVERLA